MGRGKGAGTGRPLHFQCSNCRKRKGYPPDQYYDQGYIGQVTLTGKTRSAFDGNGHRRSTNTAVQYKCNFCGHVGWSRHRDIFTKAVKSGLRVHKHDEDRRDRILERP